MEIGRQEGEDSARFNTPLSAHPDAEVVRRFARGEASRAEEREVVRHLLRRCALCAREILRARVVWR